jgi:ubiquinone/menaquinone biosynthesis C-methylase UbiE
MSYSAESYENYMVPALFAPWSSYLIRSANVQPGEHVLDVACGTGIVARNIALSGGSHGVVIGIDLNPNMLSVARVATERESLAIEWYTSHAEQLPFPDSCFDLILCQFGLMFFTNRQSALAEMHRVLRPGGRVVLSVWQGLNRHPFYRTLHEVSQRHLGKSSVQAVFSLGDPGELHRLLADSGFQRVEIEPVSITASFPNPEEFLAWEIDVNPAETPALQNLDAQAQQTILSAVRQDMQMPLHEVMQADQIVILFHAYVAHATR